MKILVTGASGFVGSYLIPALLREGHTIVAATRSAEKLHRRVVEHPLLEIVECDFLKFETLKKLPWDIDAAYYLLHSMTHANHDFAALDEACAINFDQFICKTTAKHIVYLSALCQSSPGSTHFTSRMQVETILSNSGIPTTVLRSSIIIGKGSLPFEIMRKLVEKLPFVFAPKWIHKRTQPIAIDNVVQYLCGVLAKPSAFGQVFEIGGPDTISYKQMLQKITQLQGKKCYIFVVPFFSHALAAWCLALSTSLNRHLAFTLIFGIKSDVLCKNQAIKNIVPTHALGFEEAAERHFGQEPGGIYISTFKEA